MLQFTPRFLKAGKREVEFAADLEHLARPWDTRGRRMRCTSETSVDILWQEPILRILLSTDRQGPGLSPAYPQGPGWKKIETGDIVVDYVPYITVTA